MELSTTTNSTSGGEYNLSLDIDIQKAFFRDTINYKGLEYDGDYTSNFTEFSLVTKGYVDGLTTGATNGLSLIGSEIGLGGTLSQATTTIECDSNDFYLSNGSNIFISSNNNSELYVFNNGVGLYGDDGGQIESHVEIIGNGQARLLVKTSITQSSALTITTQSSIFIDSINNKGVEYASDYTTNFTTHSLVTKGYVDTQVSNLQLDYITGITAGSGLTGGGTDGFVTLSVNVGNGIVISNDVVEINQTAAGNGLTFSSGAFAINVNSDSLEITNDILRLSSTISSNRLFTGGVTISNNFSVTGSTVLNTLTASNTYMSSTGSNTLTLYSSGTGSTIFSVMGQSGELFAVTDGLTGSLFSVNDISGLPIFEVFSDDTVLMGDYAAPSLNSTSKITTVTGSNTVYLLSTSLYSGGFFDYVVSKDTNIRAGSIMSTWYGLTASYTEVSTTDIGDTSGVTFVVGVSGSNAILTASASSNNWVIKTIIRSI